MPIALVQKQVNHDFNGLTTATFSCSATGTGNLLVLCVGEFSNNSASQITSIIDNVGNVYNVIPSTLINGGPFMSSVIWYAKNSISGGTTITLTSSVAFNQIMGYIFEFSGADTTSPFDTGNASSNSTFNTACVSGFITPTNSGDVLVSAAFADNNNFTGISTSGWVSTADSLRPTGQFLASGYLFNPSLVSQQAAYTPATPASAYASSIAAFKPASLILTLTLTDSVTLTDSTTEATTQSVSDGVSVSDSAPDAFSVESDFLTPVSTPVVETLINQLVPATIKTYFRIQE